MFKQQEPITQEQSGLEKYQYTVTLSIAPPRSELLSEILYENFRF